MVEDLKIINSLFFIGSLTTPDCNEQVNWFVMKFLARATHQDLQTFRSLLKDDEGYTLRENHRPLQNPNGRPINLFKVTS